MAVAFGALILPLLTYLCVLMMTSCKHGCTSSQGLFLSGYEMHSTHAQSKPEALRPMEEALCSGWTGIWGISTLASSPFGWGNSEADTMPSPRIPP